MPQTPQEEDTIFRNIKLITTPWTIFVFIINPFLAWVYVVFTIRRVHLGGILATHAHFTFALFVLPICVLALALATSEKIQTQLEREGYVQRRTRARELDLLLNFAVFGAFYYWLQRHERDEELGAYAVHRLAVLSGLMLWWLIVMFSIGPVLWFTVRVR